MIKLLFVFLSWSASPSDSLRMETINGKQFIIHQIDTKETLYSISRRYNMPITVILENNPSSDGGLAVGKQLKIPFIPKTNAKVEGKIHTVAAKETLYAIARQYDVSIEDLKKLNNLSNTDISFGQELIIPKKSTLVEVPKLMEIKSVSSVHTVAAKETMYSISRQYGITIQQLKEWNNIQDNELPAGKMLFVTQPKYASQTNLTETKAASAIANQSASKIEESVISLDEVKEMGMAEMMTGTEGSRKYLALHRTIKPGSILKVHNQANNKEVFVRISGVLSAEVGSDVIMLISKAAYDRLGAVESKFRIEVTYYK